MGNHRGYTVCNTRIQKKDASVRRTWEIYSEKKTVEKELARKRGTGRLKLYYILLLYYTRSLMTPHLFHFF